jgi:hypothetical protein
VLDGDNFNDRNKCGHSDVSCKAEKDHFGL